MIKLQFCLNIVNYLSVYNHFLFAWRMGHGAFCGKKGNYAIHKFCIMLFLEQMLFPL
jgi:hypothetical protein